MSGTETYVLTGIPFTPYYCAAMAIINCRPKKVGYEKLVHFLRLILTWPSGLAEYLDPNDYARLQVLKIAN